MGIVEFMQRNSVVGVLGNRGSGKSSCVLSLLEDIKDAYPSVNICVLGIEPRLYDVCKYMGIKVLLSTMDVLDLRIKNSIIFIDEMAMLFDTRSASKQRDKLMNFFDRIEHNNCKVIVGTAREGYFNKFMCSRITGFIVKEIEYASLVNGTWIKERVKGIVNCSDYRLEVDRDKYYLIDTVTESEMFTFDYREHWDSKIDNKDLFGG